MTTTQSEWDLENLPALPPLGNARSQALREKGVDHAEAR